MCFKTRGWAKRNTNSGKQAEPTSAVHELIHLTWYLYNSAVTAEFFLNHSIQGLIRNVQCFILKEPSIKPSSLLQKQLADKLKMIPHLFLHYLQFLNGKKKICHNQCYINVNYPSYRKFAKVALTWDSRGLMLIQVFKQLAYRLWENSSNSPGPYTHTK